MPSWKAIEAELCEIGGPYEMDPHKKFHLVIKIYARPLRRLFRKTNKYVCIYCDKRWMASD